MIDDYIYVILSMVLFFIVVSCSVFTYYRWRILKVINSIENPGKTVPCCPCPTPIHQPTLDANLNP